MVWIEAIMAFAVTMMALSTIVTMIVEMIHRALRLRERGLRTMMEQLYGNVLQPQLASYFNKEQKKSFADGITTPSFKPDEKSLWTTIPILHKLLNVENAKSLTAIEFMTKLARTEEGQKLLEQGKQKGDEYLKVVVHNIADRYQEIGDNAREYFARRARLTSVVVAIVLAFVINVDSVKIFQTYLNNDVLRASIIVQSDIVKEQMDAHLASLKALEQDKTPQESAEEYVEIRKTAEEIKEVYKSIAQEKDLNIGLDKSIFLKENWKENTNGFAWILSVLLGGSLIGLGGPFWFDIFQRFSAFASIAKSLQSATQKLKEEKTDGVTSSSLHERNLLDVFKRAAEAKALEKEQKLPPRPLLDTNGKLLEGE